jgi:diguanylate cyclase (GGDEF)-like protein
MDIINILLKRVEPKEVKKIANLFNQSLMPSISLTLNENLHQFSIKIENSPELVFENEIQDEIQKFIGQRVHLDEDEIKEKASEITKIMTFMTSQLANIIDINSKGNKNITSVIEDIEKIDLNNNEEITKVQSKLVNAAKTIESSISKSNESLIKEQSQVELLSSQVKTLEKKLCKAEKESETDHLTGLLTRRAYDRHIIRIEGLYSRNKVDYALVFFDIDHFKNVNDTYGHDAGAVILATFAKVLLASTRELDIVGRYGGEEFISILHYNEKKELEAYIRRVKSIVTEHKFKYKDIKIPITFSAGVCLRSDNQHYNETLKTADTLLYKAKNSGRNKIIFQNGIEL